MRKFLGIPLGVLLIVAGATAVLAQSGAGTAVLTAASGATSVLGGVLADLVDDGTINQQQADAIEDALDQRVTDLRAEAERLREQMRAFLEDGALSADELAQLPEDHPLRNLDQYLEDGQLSQEELQQLRGFGFGHGHGVGGFGGPGRVHLRGFGPGGPWSDVAPETAPEASPETEGSST